MTGNMNISRPTKPVPYLRDGLADSVHIRCIIRGRLALNLPQVRVGRYFSPLYCCAHTSHKEGDPARARVHTCNS